MLVPARHLIAPYLLAGGFALAALSQPLAAAAVEATPPAQEIARQSHFIWPTEGKVVRSFEASRKGIDIAGQVGQPVMAIGDGTVLYAKYMRGYGNLVLIDHNEGLVSAYAHNKAVVVKEGQTVRRGQRIAEMGDSDADSVRLYFEIRQQGRPVDPVAWLPDIGDLRSRPAPQATPATARDQVRPAAPTEPPRERAASGRRLSLEVAHTQPDAEGDFTITIQTNADTASLKIDGDEQGGRADGRYQIKRVARAGEKSTIEIAARDVFGNTDRRSIVVERPMADTSLKFARLNPGSLKVRPSSDSVAIIIGIQHYKRLPKAEYANNDARAFYDYAVRALGVLPENIKLLVDEQADEVEILSAFQHWLPAKTVSGKSHVYVFYSGHGLPSDDGKSLYILPHGADRQFIAKTALNQQEIITALQAARAKSVTLFMDACYSGQIRNGDTLLASARPVAVKTAANAYPSDFTVISASAPDQIASSSPHLKHGIFSYFLMKALEGEADENRDGRISVAELQAYIADRVPRHASLLSRQQQPQVSGNADRILVNR